MRVKGEGKRMRVKKEKFHLNQEELEDQFIRIATPIVRSDKFAGTINHIQHGNTSCYLHCIAVAYYSFKFVNSFRIRCNRKSMIRGALLHDYFLYDWHDNDASHKLHGFTHPRAALRNAMLDYRLSDLEKNIILRHMFPLTRIPPRYKESVIVCLIDKGCSLLEVFLRSPYPEFSCLDVMSGEPAI